MDVDRSVAVSSTVVQSRDPLAAEVDGEVVLMSVDLGRYFGLDVIGADVWRRMETPVRVSDLCAALAADYDGAPEVIERDVLELLHRMADRGLIEISG